MKHPFLKSILVLGAALTLINCNSDPVVNQPNDGAVTEACWELTVGDQTLLIYPTGVVTDVTGAPVASFIADPSNPTVGNIASVDGSQTMIEHINLGYLPILQPGSVPGQQPLSSAAAPTPTQSSANVNVPTQSSAVVNVPTQSSANVNVPTQSSANVPTAKSSSSANNQNQQTSGSCTAGSQCFDKISGKCVNFYAQGLTTAKGSQYSYNEKCEILKWYDAGDLSDGSASAGGNNQQQTQNNQQQSSSSKPKSSSSAPKSSSSQASQNNNNNSGTISSNYTIKYVNGGKSGSGYATRYWDCCEPHCAWPEHGGKASTCDASGNKVAGGSQSMCDGGNAGICRGQFPIVVSETMAFAFAATPGGENNCGKCFDLAFTGKGKYATDNHSKLKGKHLIVMSSNVGYDVAGGQFDVMIPGGGFGIFNGCSQKMGWGSQGSQYGGLLDECEKETGYTAAKYKSCLTEKCNKSFSMDAQAREGCLFMANWMEAAGNPLLEYKEVECPKELLDRF